MYRITDRCQQKVFFSLPNPTPVSSVALQIDKLDLILTKLEIKLLDCMFKLDRQYDYIMFNQGNAADWFGVTRRNVNEALAHLKELGFIAYRKVAQKRCCVYKLSSFFKLEDVRRRISSVFTFFHSYAHDFFSSIFNIANLEKVTILTKKLLNKYTRVDNVHMLRARTRENFMKHEEEHKRTSRILDGYTATRRNFQKGEMQKPLGYQKAKQYSINIAMYKDACPMDITEEEKKRIPTVREMYGAYE